MPLIALGAGLAVPLICNPGASWGAPLEEVPCGNMTQACPEAVGVKPEILTVAVWLVVGLLLTMNRVRLPDEFMAA
jgi:hypothetical protein